MAPKQQKQQAKRQELPTSVRLPQELLDQIDALAKKELRNRTNMIRVLIERGLKATK